MTELKRYLKIIKDNLYNITITLDKIERLGKEAEIEGVEITDVPAKISKGLLKDLGDVVTEAGDVIVEDLKTLYVHGAFSKEEPLTISKGLPFKFKLSLDSSGELNIGLDIIEFLLEKGIKQVEGVNFETDPEVLPIYNSEILIKFLTAVARKFELEIDFIYDWRMV